MTEKGLLSTTPAPCTILDWDSDFWGFRVATVTAGKRLDEAGATAVDEWCREHGVRCLYFSADGTCPTTLATAARHLFRFVDLRLELDRELGPPSPTEADVGPDHPGVRPADTADLPHVRRLAGGCHTDTRFFKDAGFDRRKAAELYERWIDGDHARRSLLVAHRHGTPREPIGYVSHSRPHPDRGRIGLIGVDEQHRGLGAARTLLEAAMKALRAQGCRRVEVATQATNVAALRLYARAGFLPSSATIWYHRWY